jgi:chromosome segregation ATPase
MLTVLEALRERMATRRRTHNETLLAAARRAAAGESVDDAAVDAALWSTGKDVDEFRRLVELCQRRRDWYAAMDRGPAAKATLDKLKATMDRERAAFEQAAAAWRVRATELESQISAATTTVAMATDARNQLVAPDNVPGELAARISEAQELANATADAVEQNRRERRERAEAAKTQREWAQEKRDAGHGPVGVDEHERAATRAEKRVAELDAELPNAERAHADAERELRRLESLALKV